MKGGGGWDSSRMRRFEQIFAIQTFASQFLQATSENDGLFQKWPPTNRKGGRIKPVLRGQYIIITDVGSKISAAVRQRIRHVTEPYDNTESHMTCDDFHLMR